MYIPPINLMSEVNETLKFMKRFSFGTIITVSDGLPIATHLPFLSNLVDGKVVITSHFARANSQWKFIEESTNLVIFTEPHAYISPKNYEKELNVPTWNYMAVHAYGRGKIITDTIEVEHVLQETIKFYESDYQNQWDNLSNDYRLRLKNGIVAFEIEVNDLQGKKKISQNRSEIEKLNIIKDLELSGNTSEQLIADYMRDENIIKDKRS